MKANKVVLAYSGGLDTSVCLRWVKETYDCEVIAYCADVGQEEDLDEVRRKALATGASKVVVDDLREAFVRDYVFPMLRGNAVYEGSYLLGTSIARPLIARRQLEVAVEEDAEAVSHGATGKGNDQVRFELTYYALKPDIQVIAPWREWDLNSRTALIDYAKRHDIPVPVTKDKPYSMDRNLFHISYEGGVLEDPWQEPPADMFLWTTAPEDAPDEPQLVELEFASRRSGGARPGRGLEPAEMLVALKRPGVAPRHWPGGHGGEPLRRHEVPGHLRDPRGYHPARGAAGGGAPHPGPRGHATPGFADSPLRPDDLQRLLVRPPKGRSLQQTLDATQERVTGTVRLKLYKGSVSVAGRRSPVSLYDPVTATFEKDESYNQADADGFIKLNALRLKMAGRQAGA